MIISACITPDKRLNQIEPVLADVVQKVDRLIEGNGQILDVAVRGDANAGIAARGVAELTVRFNEFRKEVREGFNQIDQKIENEVNGLRQEMNQRFDQIVTLIQDRLK